MPESAPRNANTTLICTCEGTMPLDTAALTAGGVTLEGRPAHQLCRAQLDNFRAALGKFADLTVCCTQEAALFEEIAAESRNAEGGNAALSFVNIRETAGWADEADGAGPKMAALIAMARTEAAPFELVSLESDGVALVLGAGPEAVEAADILAETLDVTVLLAPGTEVSPPRQTIYPVLQGRVRRAQGHLGAFELTIDAYAAPQPSSRARLMFDTPRDGAVSQCDLVIDLSGGAPLFPAAELRPGYLRADPRDPAAVARLVARAAQMVGTFDKPRFIAFTPDICAHSRNRLTGCTRCLELCPTGAIQPGEGSVVIDPHICAGCGQCASACPTGAAAYALPTASSLAQRLRAGLRAWFDAGGKTAPVILLHDAAHGTPLIDALARFGRGLPAHVIPLQINEITQIGAEVLAAALAYGAGGVRLLARTRPAHPLDGLEETLALIEVLAASAGLPADLCTVLSTDDPDALATALRQPPSAARARRSGFMPPDDKRGLLLLAVSELNRVAPRPAERIDLPQGAPFGAVVLDTEACTLCLACVAACPAGALGDNPDQPMLRFTESACVQCGICAVTCPEDAISLAPQIDFVAWQQPRRVLKHEPPFECTACGKPFGTRASIERVTARLADHWMFTGAEGEKRRALLTMCDDCRTRQVVLDGFDPIDKPAAGPAQEP
ncbi:MAG: 4Fe-4S binding protein [Pararhodobacter sp.]